MDVCVCVCKQSFSSGTTGSSTRDVQNLSYKCDLYTVYGFVNHHVYRLYISSVEMVSDHLRLDNLRFLPETAHLCPTLKGLGPFT